MTHKSSGNIKRPQPSLRMGEMAVDNGEEPLRTLLGSCVGLAIYSRQRQTGGLAHIVLPKSPTRARTSDDDKPLLLGKYVDSAVPEMIKRLESSGCRKGGLRAKIAGGANMLKSQACGLIGDQIVEAIKIHLKDENIPITGEHCGGMQGRRMQFWPQSGLVRIELVGGETVDI